MKKYELGEVRREIFYNCPYGKEDDLQLVSGDFVVESAPTMWGMSRSTVK